MRLIGIDFGLSRIGIAYSEGAIASPVQTVSAKTEKQRVAVIKRLLEQFDPTTIVIGHTRGTLTPDLDRFIVLVKRFFQGDITLVEESMTTVEASKHLLTNQKSRKDRKDQKDAVAAAVILQSYLDENTA